MKNAHEKLIDYDKVTGPSNRNFGFTMSVAMLFFGLITKYKIFFFASAVLLFPLALIAPARLQAANLLWAKLGAMLHKIMTPVIMMLIYVLVFVPFGYLLKLCGKNTMLKYKENKDSYWINKEQASIENPMKYQF